MEECHALVADDLGGGLLLALAERCQLERIDVRVLTALVTARAADEPTD
jgi:hypothetical protein